MDVTAQPEGEQLALRIAPRKSQVKSTQFKISGMDCAEEVAVLKREVGPVVGGEQNLSFEILNAKMTVTSDSASSEQIIQAVAKTGMRAELWTENVGSSQDAVRDAQSRNTRFALTAASGCLIIAGFAVHAVRVGSISAAFSDDGGATSAIPMASMALYSVAILSGAWLVLPKAWLAILRFRPDMNFLMIVAVAGAVALGQWFEAASVAFLFALSLTIEAWSVCRARRAVASLLALAPIKARVVHDDHEHEMDVAEVTIGSHLLVKPGEKFPLDGRVVKGESQVNQAPITGESMPVPKSEGSEVFAGTINGDGTIELTTTKVAADTTVARIIKLVGEAQSKRSPSEQWVEKFARYYTPAVMVLALGVAFIPPLFLGGAWPKWIYEGLVLLVIACPCALVISTPVSIVAALASSAKNGVLIKGGVYVEIPAGLQAIAMDKTGTLTEGRPSVSEVVPLSGHTESELLEIAAAIEGRSEHPLARAVVDYANAKGIHPKPATDFKAIQGKGASAVLDGKAVWIGSHRYLEERGQETPEMHAKLEALSAAGSSVVVIGNQEHVCGFIAVTDRVRSNAQAAVRGMKSAGIQSVIMLTGDNKGTADVVGRSTGVDEVRAELLPEDKVKFVDELVQRFGQVAMIGDGVNDAPAMARATIGIAMGAAGSDAAIETADIALMSDDLSKLPWLILHSRRTVRIIRQNIWFSLSVKAVFVLLTFLGMASLWSAIAADTGASLIVIFNGLRLLRPHTQSS